MFAGRQFSGSVLRHGVLDLAEEFRQRLLIPVSEKVVSGQRRTNASRQYIPVAGCAALLVNGLPPRFA